jgi:hypothetical protein
LLCQPAQPKKVYISLKMFKGRYVSTRSVKQYAAAAGIRLALAHVLNEVEDTVEYPTRYRTTRQAS